MDGYQIIVEKLRLFTRKFYRNELLKGIIFFFSLGLMYLFLTLFIEYFLWLKPQARTTLFWVFIAVELYLLFRFILTPIFKLIGLQKGISFQESSKIIGNHFPEVQDKLLNILQLKATSDSSDLLLASIHQKATEIQPIPFVNAIDFTKNIKYLKYALIPILIWLITLFTGYNTVFTESLDRVIHHRTAFTPPAPFSFVVTNTQLEVIQGKPYTVFIEIKGNVLPDEAKIVFDNESYYLEKLTPNTFSYTFSQVDSTTNFYVIANDITSQDYQLKVIHTPTILNVFMDLTYPRYVGKRNETIQNTGNLMVPQGTTIQWNVQTSFTNLVSFIVDEKRTPFTAISENFTFKKRIINPIAYQITSSNNHLKDYETLAFSVDVIKDEFPTISIQSNIDSITRGAAQFAGQISDDYGLSGLQLVYYNQENPVSKQTFPLSITKENVQTFYYQFPDGLDLQEGVNYELYFEVSDNDAVNGLKKTTSKIFSYRQKTIIEIDEELLEEQKNTINELESKLQNQQKQQKEFEKIQQDIQNKKNLSWNDQKKIQRFIERQEQYKKMMKRQTDKLKDNLGEKKEEKKSLQEKKEDLKKRINELKKLDKQQKLLDEIAKMAEKLNKEDLLKKAKQLAQQNKQQERSLQRTLEMIKRFYVEQKIQQIATKLDELAKKQDSISTKNTLSLEDQKQVEKEFEKLKKELEELAKDSQKLKDPMELPDTEDEQNAVDDALKKAAENLSDEKSSEQQQSKAKKAQKKSSKKMQEMSAKMKKAMSDMEGDTLEENLDDLRKILENLVTFSFKQENLMNVFESISTTHPNFGKNLKQQNELKTYFEHIDDSLYVLSMRMPKISATIQDDLSTIHYNLDQSLENFSENRFPTAGSNQQYVMTSTNNLADYLSSVLTNIKKSMSMGKGKGKKSEFSLPDIIQKQGELSKKMKAGMKKGNKKGDTPGDKKGDSPKPGDKGKEGKDGKEGKQGQDGKKGDNGKQGKQGDKGNQGNQGQSGANGQSVSNGQDGQLGDRQGGKLGKDGQSGAKGNKGKEGKQGETGSKGAKGTQEGGKEGASKAGGKGNQPGSGGNNADQKGDNDDLDGEIYKIYKEQSLLRQQLQEAIKESDNNAENTGGNSGARKVLKTMEELENEILEKGFNLQTFQKMQNINYQLLKLQTATLEQGKDHKRKSTTNRSDITSKKIQQLKFKKLFYNQTEILNRQSLPLQQNFKKKVREYFFEPENK